MSHLVLKLGDLLHFHPFAHEPATRKATPRQGTSARIVESRFATSSDDLAFFSLSVEHMARVKDRRADLDRLGLIGSGDSEFQEID